MSGAKILFQLQNLEPVSISEIAVKSGLPSTEVCTTIERLIEIGVPLKWNSKKSVCLLQPVCPLDVERIVKNLELVNSEIAGNFTLFDEIDSTNEYLLKLTASKSIHKHICVAEFMSSGRGRQRRKWVGGAYQNIILSFGWKFEGGLSQMSGLSLAVAVIVSDFLQQVAGVKFQVKWPNDILYKNRKISGILIETMDRHAVVGIGINCNLSEDEISVIGTPVTSLAALSLDSLDRNELIVRLVDLLHQGLKTFSQQKLDAFRTRWLELHAHANKRVYTRGNISIEGKAIGIDQRGALLLELSNGDVYSVNSGEISVREKSF